jgi:L,D-peptidoglycan transpeptidase YkuD (ErfK/YbiS/YcfS/YnhG family)
VGILRWIVIAALLAWGNVTDAFFDATGATVTESATRGVQVRVDAECDLTTVDALSARHPAVGQFVVMATAGFDSTSGTVAVAVRTPTGAWACQTDELDARFGRNGTRPLVERVSGDGTTPAGVFPLGVVTAWDGEVFSLFGNQPDPGVLTPYRDVRPEDCWGATRNTPRYQHLVNLPRCPGPDDEWLPRYGDVYSHAAVIGANLDPISGDEPGETPYAAAIFLHRHSYLSSGAAKTTSGCVSLASGDLVDVLRLLDPRLDPHFAIGPIDWLRSAA